MDRHANHIHVICQYVLRPAPWQCFAGRGFRAGSADDHGPQPLRGAIALNIPARGRPFDITAASSYHHPPSAVHHVQDHHDGDQDEQFNPRRAHRRMPSPSGKVGRRQAGRKGNSGDNLTGGTAEDLLKRSVLKSLFLRTISNIPARIPLPPPVCALGAPSPGEKVKF